MTRLAKKKSLFLVELSLCFKFSPEKSLNENAVGFREERFESEKAVLGRKEREKKKFYLSEKFVTCGAHICWRLTRK